MHPTRFSGNMTKFPLVLLLVFSIVIVVVNVSSLRNVSLTDLRVMMDAYTLPTAEDPSEVYPAKQENQIETSSRIETSNTDQVETPNADEVETPDADKVEIPNSGEVETTDADEAETPNSGEVETPNADEEVTVQAPPEANNNEDNHRIAGLNCEKYGGPSEEIAAEMVYWEDIPTDATFVSPYAAYGQSPKYLTFEPDEGGWNNIRMSMETATVLAQAMGRILVLPPEQYIYLLGLDRKEKNNQFTFKDFFHFDSIVGEHPAVEVISMEEFWKREVITGGLKNKFTGEVELPRFEISSWDGHVFHRDEQWMWLRNVTAAPIWSFDDCVVGFPTEPGPDGVQRLEEIRAKIRHKRKRSKGNVTAVDAPPLDRLLDMFGDRIDMCIYDEKHQNEKVMHFMGDNDSGARLLVHFYAYLFFENYHQDLWTKRFVRDHLRYIDEIQCAAARIVHAVRQKAIENGDPTGTYDSFHIRRGDFQYSDTRIPADEIYENTKDILVPNSTIFVATDERDSSFFDPLRKHYNLLFLDDFRPLFQGLNKNYIGMLDQRIASRGRTFCGAFYSTFTGMYTIHLQ